MALDKNTYQTYCNILRQELVPAMGCTEPIAIAYAAAIVQKVLGQEPEWIEVQLSRNIIKNAKSVVVPGTGGRRGIFTAVAAGILSAQPDKKLEVLSVLQEDDAEQIPVLLQRCPIRLTATENEHIFDILLRAASSTDTVCVRIVDSHTNVVLVEKNGKNLLQTRFETSQKVPQEKDYTLLTVERIIEFADSVHLTEIEELLECQVSFNMAIAEEGLRHSYGANIGSILLGDSTQARARAMAAAASDARMNGCELPVCIVSGSGNQGITASVPVVVYGREMACSREKILRALIISDLITIHQKAEIGRLSAYCGAVSAGCGCGAGIAYLHGYNKSEISHTVNNTVAILSGMICDGAKSSCAAKIAMSVDAGILGCKMTLNGRYFSGGDGIISENVEDTICNIGRLAREGMRETDQKIIEIMTNELH